MNNQRTMSLAKLLREFAPVEQLQTPGHSWDTEAAWLKTNHPRRLARVRRSIERLGIEDPIQLCYGHPDCGTERHVVDGHHRIVIARDLGIKRLPVGDAWAPGADWFMGASDQLGDDPEEATP
ncbi:hypothetical protein RVR_8271 [Actinacidiphila reveromycinica]|uniref:ParB/Sulfiredoxin domain-containing protein n=1 Tax=Actinacidiphila reveromycinica TaxID=659352 RepID=A0A7U3VRR2_9ACTN|nr:hypothetical protein [Streptomyces sp. SN-593]BBB01039.1 hypothetical protein RVR_8271 [Streptomyces sp. SN-593]